MFEIKGQIRISGYTRQAFKIKSPHAGGGSMFVYANGHLFARLSQIIEANRFRDKRTDGAFIISGRVLVRFRLGKETPAKEEYDD